jgi:O-antigen ligase
MDWNPFRLLADPMHVNYQSELAAVRADWLVWAAAGLLLVAILFGGGGAEAPVLNGLLEAGGGLLLCITAARHFAGRPLPPAAVVPLTFLVAQLILVLAQLVPLPPGWWSGLPGREPAAAIYALIEKDAASHTLSLDPEATRRFAAALLLPAGLLFAALHANRNGLIIMARAIVIGGAVSAILALAQLILGLPAQLFPYGAPGAAVTTGLFANPNHQSQLMLAAIVMCGVLIHFSPPRTRRHRGRGLPFHPVWLLLPLFMAGAITSQSRAGLILLVPALIAAILIAARRRGLARVFGLSMIAVPLLGLMIALLPGGLARGAEIQMELSAGGRITNLPDILFTLRQFWPWGSGFGTFVPVFKANENLDLMGDAYVNHAHNDLAELLIEGGLPMAVLLGAALLAMAVRLWRLVAARHTSEPATALAGLMIIILALVHSMVDYPLRMQSLAAVFAIALAFFLSPSPKPAHGHGTSPHRRGFEADHGGAR